jgi:alpha-L-arabinofuranosidase
MRAFEPVGGGVGLLTWRTEAEFKDIEITADGKKLPTPTQLERSSGNWTIQNGVIRQTALQDDRRTHFTGVSTEGAKQVTMSLKARKLRGDEGFIILFETSPRRTIQWNLGGWENNVHAFQMNGGRFGKGVPGRIETDRWYDIRIEQDERSVRGYLDGKLIEEAPIEAAPDFAAVAGIVDKTNELVLKVVNGASTSRTVALALKGVPRRAQAQIVSLAGSSLTDENSFENPHKVAPRRTKSVIDTTGKLTFPPYSLTILRIRR